MNTANSTRKNWMPQAPKSPLTTALDYFRRGDFWARAGVCGLATLTLWVATFGWSPSFPYRLRQTPLRNMYARVTFDYDDYKLTEEYRERTRNNFLCLYSNDPQTLNQTLLVLIGELFEIKGKKFEEIKDTEIWQKFYPALRPEELPENRDPALIESEFYAFKQAIEQDEKLQFIDSIVKSIFFDLGQYGLLSSLGHDIGSGSMSEIEVYPKGDLLNRKRVSVSQVRIGEVTANLRDRLLNEIRKQPTEVITDPNLVSRRLFHWLRRNIPNTLTYDATNTERELNKALELIRVKKRTYEPGERLEQYRPDMSLRGIAAAVPLNQDDLDLLYAEHRALIASESWGKRAIRSGFFFMLSLGMFGLIAQYLRYRDQKILDDLGHFTFIIATVIATIVVAWMLAIAPSWRAEIIPVMMFAFWISIAYHVELALLLTSIVAITFSLLHGYGMAEFITLNVASVAAAFMCNRIRSRTRLVNISVIVAALVFPTVIGVNILMGQPLTTALLTEALWFAGGACIAGLVMTALLPFLERWFDMQTDINLLELSDANHTLLKELVQRAPGTYNHSINVASIAEAAAEAIGANGLLCRVGSYFHDIGKIRKPEYFIENQSGVNKHDDLAPPMSRLVIIAHVKDGADLARLHRLPQRIIDLIEQHHGTTLVEYFFRRAEQQQQEKAEELQEEVSEAGYRYPGPRPQTLEAAVLMLSDAVESASRTLREPAPARIENLVYEIIQKKLEDGQFDESPISMNQLSLVERSLIKSLNAMYHARVQYPEKQPST